MLEHFASLRKNFFFQSAERERESECPAGKSKQAILKTVIEDSVASGLAGWQAGRLAGRLAARAGAARI